MNITPLTVAGLLRAALALLCSATFARSAVSFTDIRLWAGAAPGPGLNEAALVVDFHDGSPGILWGYRWPARESRTGEDMLAAILGADPSLNTDSTFFPNSFTYGARTRRYSDNGTADFTDDSYWSYWVNNDVYYHPTNFMLNSHIVPPATEVVPLGNPYETGRWVESSTGSAGRPLVSGSWDAWSYGAYSFGVYNTRSGEPVAAVPESGTAILLAAGMVLLSGRRRRKAARVWLPAHSCWTRGPAQATGLTANAFEISLQMPGAMPPGSEPRSGSPMNSRGFARNERTPGSGGPITPQPRRGCPIVPGSDRATPPGLKPLWGRDRGLKPPAIHGEPLRGSGTGSALTDGGAAKVAKLKGIGLTATVALQATLAAGSGPYPPGPAESGSDAIPAASALYTGWATGVSSFLPGPRQAGTTSSAVSYGSADSVTGPPDAAGATYPPVSSSPVPAAPVLSLGDGGTVTLTFTRPIADGEGADFAVFENAFAVTGTAVFAELAFVEVSSNGADFVRFPAVSCTPATAQTGTFGTLDPRNLHNLAGKHPAGYGTPFDLAELSGIPGLDAARITHVRLTDVVGEVVNGLGSQDSAGHWINDPFPTNWQSGGFDLDAVGVIHEDAPELSDLTLTAPGDRVVLQFTRDASLTDSVLTLQQSLAGGDWTALAVSTQGGAAIPAVEAEVAESGSGHILVTITAPRTAVSAMYRLSLHRIP